MKTIKALTICQPWAWAILNGPTATTAYKRFENRNWQSDYVGPLVIHAGKSTKWMKEGCDFLRKQGIVLPGSFEFGAALGLVDMVGCLRKAECGGDPYAFGPFCFELANPRRLAQPVPMPGKLTLWNFEAAIVAELLDVGALPEVQAGESREKRIKRAVDATGGRVGRIEQPGLW